MKIGIFAILLLCLMSVSYAGDKSCEVDLLQPKIKAAVIEEEANKPASITIAEARIRLENHHQQIKDEEDAETEDAGETAPAEKSETTAKATKKESRSGGLFDILLPSKLRDRVE